MSIFNRIAQLHEELAAAYRELAGESLTTPRRRRQGERPPRKLAVIPNDLQRAKAKRALSGRGAFG